MIKVADFGCSSATLGGGETSDAGHGTVAGTTVYMAPEVMGADEGDGCDHGNMDNFNAIHDLNIPDNENDHDDDEKKRDRDRDREECVEGGIARIGSVKNSSFHGNNININVNDNPAVNIVEKKENQKFPPLGKVVLAAVSSVKGSLGLGNSKRDSNKEKNKDSNNERGKLTQINIDNVKKESSSSAISSLSQRFRALHMSPDGNSNKKTMIEKVEKDNSSKKLVFENKEKEKSTRSVRISEKVINDISNDNSLNNSGSNSNNNSHNNLIMNDSSDSVDSEKTHDKARNHQNKLTHLNIKKLENKTSNNNNNNNNNKNQNAEMLGTKKRTDSFRSKCSKKSKCSIKSIKKRLGYGRKADIWSLGTSS